MAWFRNSYRHEECDASWIDEWSCACDDRCPVCDAEIVPYDFVDLSVVVEPDDNTKQWIVLVSPADAEHKPRYAETRFDRKRDAYAFAARERRRLSEVVYDG
jgi:hypothetical protein